MVSCTQLTGLTQNRAFRIGETRNSWRGAMAIWKIMEEKYLPPFYPEWAKTIEPGKSYSRTSSLNTEDMKPIWQLSNSKEVSFDDKIVLCTTFDNVLVKVENIERVLAAFEIFNENTSLKEQAEIIREAIKEDPEIIAIGWNQTSVNCDPWAHANEDEEEGVTLGYNLEKDTGHWFLFDELKEEEL